MAGHISTVNVRSVEVGDRILLFAMPGTLRLNAIPVELRSGAPLALRRLTHFPRAVDEIRRFLNARGSYPPVHLSTPTQTVAAFERALRGGQPQARTVSRARRHRSLETLSQAPTMRRNLAVGAVAAKSNAPRTGRPSTATNEPDRRTETLGRYYDEPLQWPIRRDSAL